MRRKLCREIAVAAGLLYAMALVCSGAEPVAAKPVEAYAGELGLSFAKGRIPDRALRVACAGSSITWGNGYLDSSYVANVDRFLRTTFADTVTHDTMAMAGKHTAVKNPKLYGGSGTRLVGAGSGCQFELEGDEVSVCFAIEREQSVGVTLQFLVDGQVHDEFELRNDAPMGRDERVFTGDGKLRVFDLGRPFTYGHEVRLNGRELKGGMNTQGYGGRFQEGDDFMVVRKYASGKPPEVHHMVWLAEPLPEGATLSVAFRYGEAITYARTTVGEDGPTLDSRIESTYGDGDLGFRMDRPCAISRGLDFRYSDPRPVRTWRFGSFAMRRIRLAIKEGNAADASFIVNFATNRYHHIMNAGIGGWHAKGLNTDRGLRNVQAVNRFKPDIVTIEYGTNDDWMAGNTFIAYRAEKGISEDDIRRHCTIWLRDVKRNDAGAFDVNTCELRIASITADGLTIDPEGVAFDAEPEPGDILIIGRYRGDNRAVRTRLVETWGNDSLRAVFSAPLSAEEFIGVTDLSELVGQPVRIKRIPHYLGQVTASVAGIREANPKAVSALLDTGYSNYRTRLLLGYPLKIRELAGKLGCGYVATYGAVEAWTFDPSRPKNLEGFLNTGGNRAADGSATYRLVDAEGSGLFGGRYLYRHFSVKVDGRERFGDGCTVDGGNSFLFKADLPARKLALSRWNNRPRDLTTRGCLPATLVFDRDVPPAGASIEVRCSSRKWSGDDCHIQGAPGAEIFGRRVAEELSKLLLP